MVLQVKGRVLMASDKDHQAALLEQVRDSFEIARLKQLTSVLESIPSFARDPDEHDWDLLTSIKDTYSAQDIKDMQAQADKLYYTNPSARGVIEAMVNFIIGKDVTIEPDDEDERVRDYWQMFWLANRMDMRIREFINRTLRHGESFIRFFEPDPSLRYIDDIPVTIPVPLIRFIRPQEIEDPDNKISHGIQTAPNDVETIINYIRKTPVKEGIGYRKDIVPASEIIHTKILVDSDVKRGISFLVGIAPYMIKHAEWLDDRVMLNKIRTIFNLIMKVSGDPSTIAQQFEDNALTDNASLLGENRSNRMTVSEQAGKRLPRRGGLLLSTPGIEYEFANLKINAEDTKEDGRAIELMVAKATSLTEYVIRGDASNANYASTMVAESPMVRMFQSYQDFFEKPLMQLYRKVIRYGIEQGHIPSVTERTNVDINPLNGEETITKVEGPTSFECKINFEALIHRDLKAEAEAYTLHRQNGWDSDLGITSKIGNNYAEVQKEIRIEDAQKMAQERRELEQPHSDGENEDEDVNAGNSDNNS
jgi:hypothetical protein